MNRAAMLHRAWVTIWLHEMEPVNDKFMSESAVELLMLTWAAESDGGKYRRQIGGGPARGVYQMEEFTFEDIYTRVAPRHYPQFRCTFGEIERNDQKATVMARLKYWSIPEPLPPADNPSSLACYWKNHYNTHRGKGRVDEAIEKYLRLAR